MTTVAFLGLGVDVSGVSLVSSTVSSRLSVSLLIPERLGSGSSCSSVFLSSSCPSALVEVEVPGTAFRSPSRSAVAAVLEATGLKRDRSSTARTNVNACREMCIFGNSALST